MGSETDVVCLSVAPSRQQMQALAESSTTFIRFLLDGIALDHVDANTGEFRHGRQDQQEEFNVFLQAVQRGFHVSIHVDGRLVIWKPYSPEAGRRRRSSAVR
eukprot:TRINITY_DN34505_c0_g1_i1.p1 TRINITY_DN34505_c0_g1~~TRINITY_DN34505_c0_g1_i1.p1  ORF type:complete len:102 (+),score=25.18 TRINITY_DN34505_c0_g1_i1:50-355(+)